MALQGKITATRGYQSAGLTKKVIMAKNISVSGVTTTLAALTDVDTSARSDGSMIQWDAAAGTFKVKGDIQDTNSNLKLIGGTF
jgi:hypothetical protein